MAGRLGKVLLWTLAISVASALIVAAIVWLRPYGVSPARVVAVASFAIALLGAVLFGLAKFAIQDRSLEIRTEVQSQLNRLDKMGAQLGTEEMAELVESLREAIHRQEQANERLAHRLDDLSAQISEIEQSPETIRFSVREQTKDLYPPVPRAPAEESQIELQSLEFRRIQPPNSCEYRVWFGTDRRPKHEDDYGDGFLNEYSTRVHYGSCVVYIPKSHDIGSLGSLPWERMWRVVRGLSADEPLSIRAIETGTETTFKDELAINLREFDRANGEIVLFVHGYNVGFEAAALRAAQLGRDLSIPGPMVFFSWPSRDTTPKYGGDEATVIRSVPRFMEFLQTLLAVPGITALNIIAHSMGNRLLYHAAQLINASGRPPLAIGNVILAAPDIDRETFRQAAEQYGQLRTDKQRRTTVYWNKSDVAIAASGFLHSATRLGAGASGIAHTDPILWVDKTSFLDFSFGHGYFAEALPVLGDIRSILVDHLPPSERKGLHPIPSDVPQYWELRRSPAVPSEGIAQ